ncbi:hypothetical protein AAFH68_35790 [Flavobacterium sp. CGRL1]
MCLILRLDAWNGLEIKGFRIKAWKKAVLGFQLFPCRSTIKKSARYDELLTIHTTFKSQSSVKIEFDCEIYNEANELLTTAVFILVFISLKTGRPTAPPDYILELFKTME